MIGTNMIIKFGVHHGKTGKVVGITEKNGEPAFILEVNNNSFQVDTIIKRQKNTIKMLPVNK